VLFEVWGFIVRRGVSKFGLSELRPFVGAVTTLRPVKRQGGTQRKPPKPNESKKKLPRCLFIASNTYWVSLYKAFYLGPVTPLLALPPCICLDLYRYPVRFFHDMHRRGVKILREELPSPIQGIFILMCGPQAENVAFYEAVSYCTE
jgi:hypothetical protein